MDENEFFRQATLHICRNLEIEKAMVSFLKYIQKVIPADRLFLERYDKGLSAMHTIVDATPGKGKRIDFLTPLLQEVKAFMKKVMIADATGYLGKVNSFQIIPNSIDNTALTLINLLAIPYELMKIRFLVKNNG